jgi:F-type H+-transporting ATPase subunit delta
MAEARTLARPYARAAFELARGQQVLDAWSRALGFAAAVSRDQGVIAMRGDPRLEQAVLVEMHLPADCPADGEFARLLAQMAEHDRLALLPEVAELFDAFKRDAEAVLKVNVTSAQALDDDQLERLVSALKQRYQRGIELDANVDPDLLGGAIIDAGGKVIDASVRGRLAQLASTLGH